MRIQYLLLLASLGALAIAATPATPAHADMIERVVAVVNDKAVFLSDLRRRAAPFLETIATQVPKPQRKEQIARLYDKLLGQLVEDELIAQSARKMAVSISRLEIDQAIGNVRSQNGMSDEQFWTAVESQGFTKKGYRQDVRKQLLRLKVINQRVRARVHIGEEQIREAYAERLRRTRRHQRFHAAHVFIGLQPEASATEVAQALSDAQRIHAGLTAKEFDTQMEKLGGGDLGWLDQGDLPAELEEALLGLDVGEISQPVRGPSGVHVFMLRERQAGKTEVPPFDQAKAALHQQLMGKALQKQETLFLNDLRREAVVDTRL